MKVGQVGQWYRRIWMLQMQNCNVRDWRNSRISVFDLKGRFQRQWGIEGSAEGELSGPIGISVAEDQVFVSDTGNHRISVFDVKGNYRRKCGGSHGSGDGDVSNLGLRFSIRIQLFQ